MQAGYKPFIPPVYKLLGWSLGGVVAHELAIELQRRGCVVESLVLLDDAFSANLVIATDEAPDESGILETSCGSMANIPEQSMSNDQNLWIRLGEVT